ncbi:hemagglutinin repeat-containing protein [Parelusimicrobium proximum]|uniref:hemagglutinin repeat-containing protein n=1 Tax=Parelusimicrobium proximum TaxID=3228953 RepID=UPI003D181D2B
MIIKNHKNNYKMKALNKLISILLAVILGLPLNAFSGGGVNASYGQSRNTVRSTDYNNSTSTAEQGAINFNVGGDMLAAGYNALAEDINMDIGGALTLESLQDEYYAKGSSFGVSGGMSMGNKDAGGKEGKGVTGGSLGVNVGSDYTDVAWVENQTSIIGTKSVDIEADSVHLKGAMIANAEYTAGPEEEGGLKAVTEADLGANDDSSYGWSDKGNLTIRANEVTYEDIVDIDNSESYSIKTGQSWGTQPANQSDSTGKTPGSQGTSTDGGGLDKIDPSKGSNTLGGTISGHDKEQLTKATIGAGQIILGGQEQAEDSELLAGLNRDIDLAQEVTRDQITGAVDESAEIDLRWFSGAGRADIAGDITNLPGNVLGAIDNTVSQAARTGKLVYDVGGTLVEVVTGDLSAGQIAGGVSGSITNAHITAAMRRECAKCTGAEYVAKLKEVANQYGIDINDIVIFKDESDGSYGFHVRDGSDSAGDIYLNAGKATSDREYNETEGHELSHAKQASDGKAYDDANEALADHSGKQYASSKGLEGFLSGISLTGEKQAGSAISGLDTSMFEENNDRAASVSQEDREASKPNLGSDGSPGNFTKPNDILHSPEGLRAQTQATIAAGAVTASILFPVGAAAVLGETGGALLVGGVGVGSGIYGAYEGGEAAGYLVAAPQDADGNRIVYENGDFNTYNQYGLYLKAGTGALGAVTAPISAVGMYRVGSSLFAAPVQNYPEGSFSIIKWDGYPEGAIKPTGPFRILEGAEYQAARDSANQMNRIIHNTHPWTKGLDLHEIHPVKFGGSPTDVANKIAITRQEHNAYNAFWRNIQRMNK